MIETREFAINDVLRLEGGGKYTNRKEDRGGPTRWGISLKGLAAARDKAVNAEDVAQLTEEEARAIYWSEYWNAVKGDMLPRGIDRYMLDIAVLSGPGLAAKLLQEVVGAKVDGVVGQKTLTATRAMRPLNVLFQLHAKHLLYMVTIPGEANDRGWVNRSCELLPTCEGMLQANPRLDEALTSRTMQTAGGSTVLSGAMVTSWLSEHGPGLLDTVATWVQSHTGGLAQLSSPEAGAAVDAAARAAAVQSLPQLLMEIATMGLSAWAAWRRDHDYVTAQR
jgi:lysozyme family protein